MSDYEVGYARPPKGTRFKTGASGNPKGRPKHTPVALAEVVGQVLNAPIEYRDRGRTRRMTRLEFSLTRLVDRAAKGSVSAAELILKVRAHAQRHGEVGVERLEIIDWLPDYPGQTADQKTQEFAATNDARPLEWWRSDSDPKEVGP